MALYYFDTSALLKRYVIEVGTAQVNQLFNDADIDLAIANITMVETFAALARRSRRSDLRREHATAAFDQAESEFLSRFIFVEVTDLIIYRAMRLTRKHALRGYDAVQLAAALEFQHNLGQETITFVCADDELNRAAAEEGLNVLNPNQLPSTSEAG